MKYELGVMDLFQILANRTNIENNPFMQVFLDEMVDEKKLYKAVESALKEHPLFKCGLKYDKGYYLETNENEFSLINSSERDRPLEFGKNTGGYLWQICYHENSISLEWCHGVTDGKGGYAFFVSILCKYYGIPQSSTKPQLQLGLESFYDKSEKGICQKKQQNGFKSSDLPYISRGYKTDCHILKVPVKELLAAAKKNDSSPAAILPPLFSQALRRHIRPSAKNKNVSCNIVIDCRVPMNIQTMHNCIVSKKITYIDRFDTMEFSLVSTIYRAILDLAVCRENVVWEATKTVDMIRAIASVKPGFVRRCVVKLAAGIMKHSDSNFTFTYLGKMNMPGELMSKIKDFNVRSWTDFGECNIAAMDFDGTLILNICENYKDKEIVPDFIKIAEEIGINFEHVATIPFEQANFRL